jgi:hypothetical protein
VRGGGREHQFLRRIGASTHISPHTVSCSRSALIGCHDLFQSWYLTPSSPTTTFLCGVCIFPSTCAPFAFLAWHYHRWSCVHTNTPYNPPPSLSHVHRLTGHPSLPATDLVANARVNICSKAPKQPLNWRVSLFFLPGFRCVFVRPHSKYVLPALFPYPSAKKKKKTWVCRPFLCHTAFPSVSPFTRLVSLVQIRSDTHISPSI